MKNSFAFTSYKNSEPPIFLEDLSTCCKKRFVKNANKKGFEQKSPSTTRPSVLPSTSVAAPPKTFLDNSSTLNHPSKKSNPNTSTVVNPSPNLQTDNQQTLIIEKPSKDHVVVQTATCVSSVTVNTGTQYIHNIYPDTNCVYVQPSTTNTQCTGTSRIVSHEMPNSSGPSNPFLHSNFMSIYDPNSQVINNNLTSESAVIIDDDTSINTDPLSTKQSSQYSELQEKIKNKPMPKSKKQSLLRTVLMNKSIESMKKHLQNTDTNTKPCSEPFISAVSDEGFGVSPNINVAPTCTDQNVEEPILKSIIQTATERLLNLKRKAVPFETIDNSNQHRQTNLSCDSGESSRPNLYSKSKHETLLKETPKIKVRAVEELLEQRQHVSVKKDELTDLNESKTSNLHNVDSNKIPQEINVTVLKQSIIEASRILVNTQKKFKELAKSISNQVTFPAVKAAEMVTTFQDILKLCQKQIEVIDNNIISKYNHISVQSRKPANSVCIPTKPNNLHLQKRKQQMKRIHFSRTVSVPKDLEEEDVVDKSNTSNDSSDITYEQNHNISREERANKMVDEIHGKRKQDSVDFNPLSKKVVLGSPGVANEEFNQINTPGEDNSNQVNNSKPCNSLLTTFSNLYLKTIKKKKDVWTYKSRKRSYSKNKLTRKKIRRSFTNVWNEKDREFLPKMQSKYIDERLRERKKKSCRPLRSSERKHPSSAAFAASLLPSQENISNVVAHLPDGCVIKPCSVLVHRLDIRIVELMMEKRLMKL